MSRYFVQFLVVREVEVEATDDLQAEREAYQQLSDQDQGAAIAMQVLNRTDPDVADDEMGEHGMGGALAFDDRAKNWKLAREKFHSVDETWVA